MSGSKNVVHLHDGILCNRKKERVLLFATAWVERESIILSEGSQAVKKKYRMISPISGKTFCITGQSLHIVRMRQMATLNL